MAFAEARIAYDEGEVPVGAVIVKDGVLLGKGHNRTKSLLDPTAHAEIIAISAACQALGTDRLDNCDIYTTLEPCPMCAGGITLARIKRLYFAAEDPRMGSCGSIFDIPRDGRPGHKVEVYRIDGKEEALKLLHDFYAQRRTENQAATSGKW